MSSNQDIIQPQLLHGTLSGNTSHTSHGTLSGNTSDTSDDTLSGNTSHTSDDTLSGNTSDTSDEEDTQKQFFDACEYGTLDDIKNMVNIDVNVGDRWGATPLFKCCRSNVSPVDKIKYLVSHQADINARTCNRYTILHWACWWGTLSTVEYLVDDLHMNVNTEDAYQTPLFACCESIVNPVDKVKYLVSHQADIKATDGDNQTILHAACYHGTLSTVKYLVDNLHMDVHAEGHFNMTPLFGCCASSVSPVDKIKYLISHQVDINVRRCGNFTVLHAACYHGTLSTVKYLVDCLHIDVHEKSEDGETALDFCRGSESDEKIKYITNQMKLK